MPWQTKKKKKKRQDQDREVCFYHFINIVLQVLARKISQEINSTIGVEEVKLSLQITCFYKEKTIVRTNLKFSKVTEHKRSKHRRQLHLCMLKIKTTKMKLKKQFYL